MRLRLYVRSATLLLGAFAAVVVFAGCDSAPGAGDLVPVPPALSNFSFTPVEFEYTGSGDTAQIPLLISVSASNPGGHTLTVEYFVRRQFNDALVAQGVLSSAGGTSYTGGETVSVPRGDIGLYVITVTVVDDAGNVGNEATGLMRFASENLGPPVITEIEGPAEFEPPGQLQLVAVVTDPDGLGNIARVEGIAPNGNVFEMFDDGFSLGDAVAGDGRYTATFDVPKAEPGEQTFRFTATDNFGAESEEVSFTITILP